MLRNAEMTYDRRLTPVSDKAQNRLLKSLVLLQITLSENRQVPQDRKRTLA